MKEQINDLKQFHKSFNATYNETSSLIEEKDYELRFALLKEENEEYLEACRNNDKVEILDALTDQLYIVLGTVVSHGMQDIIEKAFNEVHASNMSKLDNDGKPIINGLNGVLDNTRPIGKVLKSNNFFEPDLKQLINN
jgi:predicted HAD superfamily Cof-like phosphohydrolase